MTRADERRRRSTRRTSPTCTTSSSATRRPRRAPCSSLRTVRGALARADAVLGQHGLDLDRTPAALAELRRAYAWRRAGRGRRTPRRTARVRSRSVRAGRRRPPRPQRDGALAAGRRGPAVARGAGAGRHRAARPDRPTRRRGGSTPPTRSALTGARRALLVERGVLALDAGGADGHIAVAARALRSPSRAPRRGRSDRRRAATPRRSRRATAPSGHDADDPGGNAGPTLLWGGDVRSPPGDGWTTAVARGRSPRSPCRERWLEERALRAQVERDGGSPASPR